MVYIYIDLLYIHMHISLYIHSYGIVRLCIPVDSSSRQIKQVCYVRIYREKVESWSESVPDVIVAWITTFLSNVGDLNAGVIGLPSFPVSWKDPLRPDHFAVVACGHHEPELQSSGWYFVSNPHGSVASGHVTPV